MPIRYFLAPYKFRPDAIHPWRYCAVDDFTRDVLAEGGDWRESEIDGNRAIVRVRAGAATLARIGRGSDVPITWLADPAAVWTPYRAAPINRGGEIAFDSGQRSPTLPLAEIIRAVRDDRAQAEYARRVRKPGTLLGYTPGGRPILSLAGMAFPTQGVIDNFNRASLGANWTTLLGTLAIASSTVLSCSGTPGIGEYNVSTYGAGSECYVTVPTVPTDGQYVAVLARMTTLSIASTDGYMVRVYKYATTDEWQIHRIDNASATQLGATISQEWAAGDSIGIQVSGSTTDAYFKTGGSWSSIGNRSDATYGSAGYLGVIFGDTTARLDDFGGGTISTGGSPQTISLAAASLAAGGQHLTPTPGAISKTLSAGALAAGGQNFTVTPGAVSKALAAAALVASGQHLTITPGAISKTLSAAALAAGGPQLSVVAVTSIGAAAAALSAQGQGLTVASGAVSKSLSAAALSASGQAMVATPGAVSKALSAAALAASGQPLTVTPGAVSKALAAAALVAGGQNLSVVAVASIAVSAAALSATGQSITPAPGAISKALAAAELAASGQALVVTPGAISAALAAAALSAEGQAFTVSTVSAINLLAAALAAQGQAITVTPGAVSKALMAAALSADGQHLTPTPGAVSRALTVAQLSVTGQALSVQPGAVSRALVAALLAAQGQAATPTTDAASATIQLLTAALAASGQHLTPTPGAVSLLLVAAVLSANGPTAAVYIGTYLFPGAILRVLGQGRRDQAVGEKPDQLRGQHTRNLG